jgi:hypothetical protein
MGGDHLMTQIVLGAHQPVTRLALSLPAQQKSRREVGAVKDRQGLIGGL